MKEVEGLCGTSTSISLQLVKFPKSNATRAVSLHMACGANAVCHLVSELFCCCPSVIPECVPNYVASLAQTKEDNLIRNKCWTLHVISPSGLTEIFTFKMYISSFAIWVICYTFYGKSEVGQLTHTTLKQTSLYQDKQRIKATSIESMLNMSFASQFLVP